MLPDRLERRAGVRDSLPLLLGVTPFGLVTGVALSANGVPPLAAMAISIFVFAGASTLAAAQLLAAGAPIAIIVLTTLFINLRFVMYSASLRPHLAHLPLGQRALCGFLLADNPYALSIARFTEHPDRPAKAAYYLASAVMIYAAWQVAVAVGIAIGARLPAAWKLEFAAPLAFIAICVPILRDRAMVTAAIAAGITVIAAAALPMKLNLALAAVVGIAAGMLAERRPQAAA